MSGVEAAAGLALAILPILLSATNHYDDCWSPFLRYKKYSKEAKKYHQQLEVLKTIYRNECLCLLEDVVEHEVAINMLNLPTHNAWLDGKLDGQVVRQLGDSKDACIAIIELIEQHLQEIDDEHKDFNAVIDQAIEGNKNFVKDRSWKRRVGQKLCFSFSKSRLDRNVTQLRLLNGDFKILSQQTRSSALKRALTSTVSSRDACREIERCHIIRKASHQVYEALGNACTKHTEHQAHCCVEVEQAVVDEEHGSQVKFNMAFTHLTLAGAADKSDLLWFVMDSTISDAVALGSKCAATLFKGHLAQTLKRRLDPIPAPIVKKVKKSVRFQMPTPATTPSPNTPTSLPPATMIPPALDLKDSMRKDFCDYLRRYYRQPLQETTCVCVLEDTDNCRNVVYPSTSAINAQRRQAVSLGQLISSFSNQGATRRVPLYEKLRLAKTLAVAVLQYHATPWLRTSWRSEDVYFFGLDEGALLQEMPSLTAPHLNVKVRGPNGQLSRASTFPTHSFVRNPLLFSLGIVLLEIAHSSHLESLQRPSDLENNQENRYTEFFVARRLAKAADTDMGRNYHSIVERLVECDFGCGNDLNDQRLQIAFYNDVICPLDKLEQRLRDFHFGA